MANDYSIQVGDTAIDLTYVTNSVSQYNLTCNVVRMTRTNTALGVTNVPVNIVTAMPCEIKWKTGKEKVMFDKDTHLLDAVLHCRVPAGVTIVNTDKIYYNSEYYEIVDVVDVNNLGVLLKITIKKVT